MDGRFTHHILQLVSSEARVTASSKPASYRILQVLNLRNVVKNIPLLCQALKGCQSQLLRIICEVKYSRNSPNRDNDISKILSDERIDNIEKLVSAHLNEESAPSKVCTIVRNRYGWLISIKGRACCYKRACICSQGEL